MPAKIPKLKIKFGFGSGLKASKAEEKKESKEQKGKGAVLLNGRLSDASHGKETETETLTNGGLDKHAEESHSATLLRLPTKPVPATSVEFSGTFYGCFFCKIIYYILEPVEIDFADFGKITCIIIIYIRLDFHFILLRISKSFRTCKFSVEKKFNLYTTTLLDKSIYPPLILRVVV